MAESKSTKTPVPRSGIYMIRCTANGRVYIGSAVYIKDRWSQHRTHLGQKRHYNSLLQRAWNKYSSDAFEWVVLEHVERERLIEREQHYIDLFKARDRKHGFNFCQARSPLGRKLSARTRAKISEEHREAYRNMSPEERARRAEMSRRNLELAKIAAWEANRGATRSSESRRKMAESHIGKKASLETRAKMSEAQCNRSVEDQEKWAETRRQAHAPEARAKAVSRQRSPEARAKAAEKQRGRKPSLETRAKMSEAHRKASAEMKAKRAECLRLGHSPEARAKAQVALGSPEARAKNSDRQRGRILTPEHREKLREAHRNASDEMKKKRMECLKLGRKPGPRPKAKVAVRPTQQYCKDSSKSTSGASAPKEKKTQSWFNF